MGCPMNGPRLGASVPNKEPITCQRRLACFGAALMTPKHHPPGGVSAQSRHDSLQNLSSYPPVNELCVVSPIKTRQFVVACRVTGLFKRRISPLTSIGACACGMLMGERPMLSSGFLATRCRLVPGAPEGDEHRFVLVDAPPTFTGLRRI
jgi:hypothetical protein